MRPDFGLCIVYYDDPEVPHDVMVLAGHLRYARIPYRVWKADFPVDVGALDWLLGYQVVAIASKYDENWTRLDELCDAFRSSGQEIVLAGRELTHGRERFLSSRTAGEEVIFGDCAKTLSVRLLNRATAPMPGRLHVGELLDASQYETPFDILRDSDNTVLWSIGCSHACGYCLYGSSFREVYGDRHQPRFRGPNNVCGDIRHLLELGHRTVRLCGDQILRDSPHQNLPFLDLCHLLGRSPEANGMILRATVSTKNVVENYDTLRECAKSIGLLLDLKIDFVSDECLRFFQLPTEKRFHLDALRICSVLGIPFEINYIFEHPLLTEEQINEFFEFLRLAQPHFSHNYLPFGYYVLNRMLLTRLEVDRCSGRHVRLMEGSRATRKARNFYNCVLAALRLRQGHFAAYLKKNPPPPDRLINDFLDLLHRVPDEEMSASQEVATVRSVFAK